MEKSLTVGRTTAIELDVSGPEIINFQVEAARAALRETVGMIKDADSLNDPAIIEKIIEIRRTRYKGSSEAKVQY